MRLIKGKKIKLGIVGGGPKSWIGHVHRISSRFDDEYEIVSGVFSRNSNISKTFGKKIGIDNMEEGFLIEVGNKWMRIYKEGEKFKADDFDSVMKDILNNNN